MDLAHPTHQYCGLNYLCLFQDCKSQCLCCQYCVSEQHQTHQAFCIKFEDVVSNTLEGLKNKMEINTINKLEETVKDIKDTVQKLHTYMNSKWNLVINKQSSAESFKKMFSSITSLIDIFQKSAQSYISILFETNQKLEFIFRTLEQEGLLQELQGKILDIEQKSSQLTSQLNRESNYLCHYHQIILKQQEYQPRNYNQEFENYMRIKENLIKENKVFIDENFFTDDLMESTNGALYIRAKEFCENGFQFFPHSNYPHVFGSQQKIALDDIIQGVERNDPLQGLIYLMASFCPDKLLECFITKEIDRNGIYAVRLFDKLGASTLQYVDDHFPYLPDVQISYSLIGKNSSIWIMVLEKALVKLLGSYSLVSRTIFQKLLYCLIRCSFDSIYCDSYDFLQTLKQFLKNSNFILVFPKLGLIDFGLNAEHFYQVTDVITVSTQRKNNVELIKLQSPWGGNLWKGDWSMKSNFWNKEMIAKYGLDNKDNSYFYMDINTFTQSFLFITSYRINEKLQKNLIFCTRKNQASYFKLDITLAGYYIFAFYSRETMFLDNQLIVVSKIENNNKFTYVDCLKQQCLNEAFTFYLEEGSYILYCKIVVRDKESEDLSFDVYGQYPPQLIEIQKTPNLLTNIFWNEAIENGKSYEEFQNGICKVLDIRNKGWLVFAASSIATKQFMLNIDFTEFQKAKLCKPFEGNQVHQIVKPGKPVIVIVKCCHYSNVKYNVTISSQI